jgi:hypothetical protein
VSLHHASFSTAAQVSLGAALRSAVQHAREADRDPMPKVVEMLSRDAWPAPLEANLGVDYPDVKRTQSVAGLSGLDQWVRAGYCHGVIDTLDRKDCRVPSVFERLSREQRAAYTGGYMMGCEAMTGVDA